MDPASELRSYGISPSLQRMAIYRYLKTHPTHPAAETIFRDLKESIPTMSLTTVYNTLRLLHRKKAILTVIIEDGELRYDGDTRDHAHFKCTECGNVTDIFPAENAPLFENAPALPPGFTAESIHLCYCGCCSSCAGKG